MSKTSPKRQNPRSREAPGVQGPRS